MAAAVSGRSAPAVQDPDSHLPPEYRDLPLAGEALFKLIRDYEFCSVLDIGSGAGRHKQVLEDNGKNVTALDVGRSVHLAQYDDRPYERIDSDFLSYPFESTFDCIWASHVLEHQPNPGLFIDKCISLLAEEGILAITVPPLKHDIVGGHLSLWNAGLLVYHLAVAGLDCSDAAVKSYGYNISVIVSKRTRPDVELRFGRGDIDILKPYLPGFFSEGFDGRIESWNW